MTDALTWVPHDTPARLRWVTECRTYTVAADKPTEGHMPWWIARHSSGREIAAGYGDDGLAKCQRYSEQDSQRAHEIAATEQSPTESFVCESAAPVTPTQIVSSTVPTTSAQAALF